MVDATVHLLDRGTVRADVGYVMDGATMGSAAEPNPDHEFVDFVGDHLRHHAVMPLVIGLEPTDVEPASHTVAFHGEVL